MSEPNTAYSGKTLELHNVGVIKYDNLIALKLAEYGSNIKSLFFLDKLLITADGFVGAVEIGGLNASMHAAPRLSKGRLENTSNGKKYMLLNDAGLNTFAYAFLPEIKCTAVNHIRADYTFKSAYYSDSAKRGIEIRGNSGVWNTIIFSNTLLPAKNTENIIDKIINSNLEYPVVIDIRPFIENSEGRGYGNTLTFSGLKPIENLSAIKIDTPCNPFEEVVISLWMTQENVSKINDLTDVPQFLDIYAYQDDTLQDVLSNGYYAGLRTDYTLVLSGGQFIQAIYCPPLPSIKVYVVIEIYDNGVVKTIARKSPSAGFTQQVTITGTVSAYADNVIVGQIPVYVTIPANQEQGISYERHSLDYPDTLEYDVGVLTEENNIISSSEIQGNAFTRES